MPDRPTKTPSTPNATTHTARKRSGDVATSGATNEIEQFLQSVKNTPAVKTASGNESGQLIFALDATASRQATWDQASALQADMFTNTEGLSGLKLQLVYFRGYDECRASPWLDNASALLKMMNKIQCVAGRTQINRVLKHAIAEAKQKSVQAVVFVGDAVEEDIDELGDLAGQLKILGLPVFVFQEGHDVTASIAFKQIATISGGAHCRFDHHSAHQLGQLLNAVAIYAAGGQAALKQLSLRGSKQAELLLKQLN